MSERRVPAPTRTLRRRALDDRLTAGVVGAGGGAVFLAISAILVYLLWVVAPLFTPVSIDAEPALEARFAGEALLLDVEDSGEIAFRLGADATLSFFSTADGRIIEQRALAELGGEPVLRVLRPAPDAALYALELPRGRFLVVEFLFPVSFSSGERQRNVRVEFPFGTEPIDATATLEAVALPLRSAAVHLADTTLAFALLDAEGALHLVRHDDADRGLPLLPPTAAASVAAGADGHRVLLGGAQWLYVLGEAGDVQAWDIRFPEAPRLATTRSTQTSGPAQAELLLGGFSVLVATDDGRVHQWFPVREDDGWRLVEARAFELDDAPRQLLAERRRRGFLTLAADGTLTLFHTTAERRLLETQLGGAASHALVLSPRGDLLLAEDADGRVRAWQVHNEHPEVSLSALFSRVWYEGYREPEHIWQSSAASNEFEPKFGLAPLAVGTFKASFYAMLFAIPLAILAAVHSAYFMAPGVRAWAKPGIEIMAALPTVILGFLAGLWLAPLVEARLTAVLGMIVLLPVGVLLFGMALARAPLRWRQRVPDGWRSLIVLPLLVLLTMLAFDLGPRLELLCFDGDLRAWLRNVAGLDYDQRNALIVGIAMGVAIVPIVFTISEDAIHSVPRHLVNGSLALGADRWQTLLRVVLPTASPGIFSAVMIGFGRGVGETMIVLMASGNTPIMDMDLFNGMRTFAANIAVELPESEVGSSHYRILFLAALLLFIVTFLINTIAELVRQRLRDRYGHL
ncbi:MAG TPA: ABC transporter permease subunit [Pseudomonadales bacterium]|nr:ABC transporter permease subunit [Pseudomonadales bacterium]